VAGVVYEGEEPPHPAHEDLVALRVWNMLNNGMGGLDWSGLPLAAAMFDVGDMEDLITRVLVIKGHSPPKDDEAPPPAT
jgi:hypothetical protein